ncbi:hypothetical protein GL4_0179 [Methyloceanibacter caenitepidi]|uniref:Uncharacterized protein n=1 Tax=Methyloceanibacter caenitepidi TaxID=1384459 RepID=A0A0A8K0W9_9HYPH|nr:hypothetical protein GL4_0179 [Methyloceanibacter caenitepidi]
MAQTLARSIHLLGEQRPEIPLNFQGRFYRLTFSHDNEED